jgi:type II secretion system protein J
LKGFTLLEILVSITVIGLIMGIVYGAYSSNVEAIQMARQGGQVFQTARIVLDMMRSDLESAFLVKPKGKQKCTLGMICEDRDLGGRPADRIDFTTLTHRTETEEEAPTDLCEVGYYLLEDQERGGQVLYRRDQILVDEDLTGGGRLEALTKGVTALDITLTDRLGNECESWNSLEEEHRGELPALIRVRLTLLDPFGSEEVFLADVCPGLGGNEKEGDAEAQEQEQPEEDE